jgi:O-antigen/teichoic acid export membrane protein
VTPASTATGGVPAVSVTRGIAVEAVHRFVGRALGGALSLLALHVALRHFGAGRWGEIVAASAWVGIFAVLGEFGIGTAGARDLPDPETGSPRARSATFVVGLASSVVATLAMLAAGAAVYHTRPAIFHLVVLLAPMVPFAVLWTIGGTLLSTYRRSNLRAVLDVLSSALLLGTALVVTRDHLGTGWYATGVACSTVATGALAVVLVTRVAPVKLSARHLREDVVARVVATRVVGIVVVSNLLYAYADIFLLSLLATTAQVGYYGVAAQVAGFVMAVPLLVLNPAVGRFLAADRVGQARILQYLLDVLVGGVLLGAAVLFVASRRIMELVAGPAAAGATIPFTLLLVATVLLFVSSPVVSALVWTRHEGVAARIYLLALVVNVGVNLGLDPWFGARGAAGAMIASETVICVAGIGAYRARTGFSPRLRVPLVSGFLAALVVLCGELARYA